jgi:hypothetical protein
VALFVLCLAPARPATAAPAPAVVTLVQGVRGLVADVAVDGKPLLSAFASERSTEPFELGAGPHTVDVAATGSSQNPKLTLHAVVPLNAGAHVSIVVHLDGTGALAIARFDDDVSRIPPGAARVVVRNVASVSPVVVALDGQLSGRPIGAEEEIRVEPLAGPHQLAAVDPTSGQPALPPQAVVFAEGTVTFVYLIGSQAEGTLAWTAVRVAGLQSVPTLIQTGDGSATAVPAPRSSGSGIRRLWAVAAATLVLAGAALLTRAARRTPRP